jgi:hypothetical protein
MDTDGNPPRLPRQRVTDDVAADFIRLHLVTHPSASYTSALQAFRAAGFAFEQSRFRDVFRQVRPGGTRPPAEPHATE